MEVPAAQHRREASSAVSKTENILLIRFKSIGDILFTLPAVHVVRSHFPNARITLLTSKENVQLIRGFNDVDEVFGIDRAVYQRLNPSGILRETISLWRWLSRERFSLVVDFQGYGETGLITWLSRAGNRWGNVYKPKRSWAYTRPVRREKQIHPADWNLSLLRQCGLSTGQVRNEFVVPSAAIVEANRFLALRQLTPDKPIIFLQPFTSTPRKNWPLENFLSLASHWRAHGVQVLFGGGPADELALAPALKAGFPVSAGVPLLVSAGLVKLSTLIIGGDTGLLHLAVAAKKRVLMLLYSTKAARCHPFQHPDWIMHPAEGEAISAIPTSAVIDASARAMAEVLYDPTCASKTPVTTFSPILNCTQIR